MDWQPVIVYGSVMGSAGYATVACYPWLSQLFWGSARSVNRYHTRKVEKAVKGLDDLFVDVNPAWLKLVYGISPLVCGVVALVVTRQWPIAAGAAVAGILIPDLWVRRARVARKQRFRQQLIDALFVLSSSLRAGLSMPQAFEELATEMSPPSSQEFGLVIKAYRLGQPLEEALQGLSRRIPCDELQLMTTAMQVARETGGDVTAMITQLIMTIRERKKILDKVKTLTIQGKLQSFVMTLIPVVFGFAIRSFNPTYFQIFLTDPVGQRLLVMAGGLWLVGIVLLFRLSKVDI